MRIDSLEMPQKISSGLTPIAIPEAKSSQTGVSVKYVFDPTKKWFVLRASYGREDKVANELITHGHYAYVAKRFQWELVNGKRRKILKSLIPNIVFSYLSPENADMLVRDICPEGMVNPCPQLSYITSYYYNHFEKDAEGKNPPIEIPGKQMRTFILGTCSHDENIVTLQKEDYHFLRDEEVEVIAGPFIGVRGRVIRAGGQQRILLRLTSPDANNVLGEFGTAFIPKSHMRKVEQ